MFLRTDRSKQLFIAPLTGGGGGGPVDIVLDDARLLFSVQNAQINLTVDDSGLNATPEPIQVIVDEGPAVSVDTGDLEVEIFCGD